MDYRAFRVAQRFVRAQIRKASFPPEFIQWTEGRRFSNPNPEGRLDRIKFNSLPPEEQQRIYEYWRGAQEQEGPPQETPESRKQDPHEFENRVLDIAQRGHLKNKQALSSGGNLAGPVNESYIVELELNGESKNFIYKPAEGESPNLRVGIPTGQYHAREQATYGVDRLIGGRGLVPPTHTRGSEDGSYQLWSEGSKPFKGKDFSRLVSRVPLSKLSQTPDFERLNLLDLITGNEDRHPGNVLFLYEGEERPENLRLIAIDNGLTFAAPSTQASHRLYVNPFMNWYNEPDNLSASKKRDLKNKHEVLGDQEVAMSLAHVSPELHARIKGVDLSEMGKALTDSGIDDEGVVRAALVRMAALQSDPGVFAKLLDQTHGDLHRAWQEFQHISGTGNQLLDLAEASDRAEDIQKALEKAKPKSGWGKSFDFDAGNKAMQDAMQDADNWGRIADPRDWVSQVSDPKHQEVLTKILDRGEINEEELQKILGTPRKVRQFALEFDKYQANAPFGLEIVQSSKGKTYKKVDEGTRRDAPTREEKRVDEIKFDEHGFVIMGKVRDRWLSAKTGNPRGRKLTVSFLDLNTREAEVLGEFELDSNNKVIASYRDFRFRNDIERGVPLMGLLIRPEDGPRFMYALEKVYGSRTAYVVKRS